jgi:hypothetical protein
LSDLFIKPRLPAVGLHAGVTEVGIDQEIRPQHIRSRRGYAGAVPGGETGLTAGNRRASELLTEELAICGLEMQIAVPAIHVQLRRRIPIEFRI